MHAMYTAPEGVGCECTPAPCGGVAVDKGCIWHRDTANLWHAAEQCEQIRARRNRKTTARPESVGLVDAIHEAHT